MSCCRENNTNLTLNQIYGWSLGYPTGIYSWPYAACSGKINENGIFVPLASKESLKICKEYCEAKKNISGETNPSKWFADISDIQGATTCEQECQMIMDSIKTEENFESRDGSTNGSTDGSAKDCSSNWWIILLVLIIGIITALLL